MLGGSRFGMAAAHGVRDAAAAAIVMAVAEGKCTKARGDVGAAERGDVASVRNVALVGGMVNVMLEKWVGQQMREKIGTMVPCH